MLYTSERNYGCRFKEVVYHGMRTVILENELISTTILVDLGTTIISLNYKPKDAEFMWTNPMGLSSLYTMRKMQFDPDYIVDNYIGGWFECFPNMGGSCKFKGKTFLSNAEVQYLPWEYSVVKDTAEELTLKFFVKCLKTPFYLEKEITIKSNVPTLFMKEKAENLSDKECEYLWGHHPNVGGRFLDSSVKIDFPKSKIKPVVFVDGPRKKDGYEYEWPYAEYDGVTHDYSFFPERETKGGGLIFVADMQEGWGAIRNENKKLGIGYSWDNKMFTNAIVWICNQKGTGHGEYGGKDLITIFPKSGDVNAIERAYNEGDYRTLKGRESVSSWFNVTVFESDTAVERIDENGSVTLKNSPKP